jgi:hypothetical protein
MDLVRIFYFSVDPIFYSATGAKNAIWLAEPQVKATMYI